MLSYALAIAVAISSLVLFSTAFLMSDIHRQDDFLWSGIGLFYALVLWFCARNITGAVLLGQAAAATLLVSYSWQTLKLRKAVAHPERAVEINNFSVLKAVNGLLKRNKSQPQPAVVSAPTTTPAKVTEKEIAIPNQASTETKSSKSANTSSNLNQKKSGVLGKLFSRRKKSSITNTKLDDILEEKEENKTSNPVESPAVASINTDAKVKAKTEPIEQVEKVQNKVAQIPVFQPSQPEQQVETQPTEVLSQPQVAPVEAPEIIGTKKEGVASSQVKIDNPPIIAKEPETTAKDLTTNPDSQKQVEIQVDNPSVLDKQESETIAEAKPDTQSNQEVDISQVEIKPASPSVLPETREVAQRTEPVAKPSSLDSLETVEVAEVLDALPDDTSGNRDADRSNIIEVTTTEISITTEVKEIEQNQDQNSDSN